MSNHLGAAEFRTRWVNNSSNECSILTHTLVREPDEVFNTDLKAWCEDGIQKYREKDQRCGYILDGGGPCINKRPTHEYEHCDEKGTRAPGFFDESQKLSPDTTSTIHGLFIHEYWKLCTDEHEIFILPRPEQVRLLRETNMQEFKQYWKDVQSNKTCLGCLQAVPDHMLECGHSFCDRCVQEFGKPSEWYEYGWVVNSCILCQSSWQDGRHLFRLHPICAGVRALALDGGGIRGIVEISLLEKLHTAIDLDFPLRDCFDIIVGTSTGKFISLFNFFLYTRHLLTSSITWKYLRHLTNLYRWHYCPRTRNTSCKPIHPKAERRIFAFSDQNI